MLEGRGVTVSFGAFQALRGVDFSMEEGEVIALTGPNGSGKTTLLNVVSGFVHPVAGRVRFFGEDLTGLSPHRIRRRGIARSFQQPSPFFGMTLLENVMIGALFGEEGIGLQEAEGEALQLLEAVGLAGQERKMARALSFGELKRLELALALSGRPKLLLLDEPLSGLSPAEASELVAVLKGLRDRRVGLFLIEHDTRAILELADQAIALDHGEVIAQGKPETVLQDPKVRKAYWGE